MVLGLGAIEVEKLHEPFRTLIPERLVEDHGIIEEDDDPIFMGEFQKLRQALLGHVLVSRQHLRGESGVATLHFAYDLHIDSYVHQEIDIFLHRGSGVGRLMRQTAGVLFNPADPLLIWQLSQSLGNRSDTAEATRILAHRPTPWFQVIWLASSASW